MSPDVFPGELPIFGQPPPERADAAKNRVRILAAAAKLFAERGANRVSMDDVAEAAGVGKGTLYRRFGDKAGLAQALLEPHEIELQERILRGPQPLGPGGPAGTRLVAFVDALAEMTLQNLDIALIAEQGAARFDSPPYQVWRLHAAMLLAEARPDLHPGAASDALLAPLAADVLAAMRRSGSDGATIRATIRASARSLASGEPPGPRRRRS